MSRVLTALATCLVIVLLLPGAAMADQSDEAQQLLDQSQTLIEETVQLDQKAGELMGSLGQLDPAKDRDEALATLADAREALDEMSTKATSAAALYDQGAELDVSDELKTYFAMQKETVTTALQTYAIMSELLVKAETLWGQWSDLSQGKRTKLTAELTELASEAQASYAAVSEKDDSATQYFNDNDLGEELGGGASETVEVDTGVLIGVLVGGLVVALFFAFLCGYLARRKGRSVALWAILGFLFPLIALIVIAVLSDKKKAQTDESATSPPGVAPEQSAEPAPEAVPAPDIARDATPGPAAVAKREAPQSAPEATPDALEPAPDEDVPSAPAADAASGHDRES